MSKSSKDQQFDSELGSKALVEHHIVPDDEHSDQLRLVLEDIALDIQKVGHAPKGMQYVGSVAVHIYQSHALRTFAFAGQLNLKPECHFKMAEAAGKKMAQDIVHHYRGSRQTLRSGF